ncbi:hypothetical protein JCM5353_006084 [Sporobolomyces roseus]
MWKKDQPWSLLRILFFLNRYFSIWVVVCNLVTEVVVIPAEFCRKTIWLLVLNGTVIVLLADSILAIRAWAISERSRKVLVFLTLMLLAEAGVFIAAAVELHPLVLPPQVKDLVQYYGCVAAASDAKAQQIAFM